jgi:glycosyltransferase involved in cell wall biosynthesis
MLKNLAISVLNRVFSYLPCYVISHEPLIIITYWHDFVITQDEFLASLGEYEDVHILIQIGWHRETAERAQELVDILSELKAKRSGLHFTFLCNSPHEEDVVKAKGLNAVFCHQNAFVDEKLYPIIPNAEKLYDAIYVARVTPFKRQELAQKIKTLRLIGWTSPLETDYFNKIMSDTPQAKWTCNVASNKIYKEINSARVGLCLSSEEGAMFVSAEYMLCGIPSVTTKNMGGREALFPEEAFCYVDDTPESVAEGVYKLIENSPAPSEIRQTYIKNMLKHRQIFIDLVQSIISSTGGNFNFEDQWEKVFIHKFGLRRRISIWTKIKRGIKRK